MKTIAKYFCLLIGVGVFNTPLYAEDLSPAKMAGGFWGCETVFKERKLKKALEDWIDYRPEFERLLKYYGIVDENWEITSEHGEEFWEAFNNIKESPEDAEFSCGFTVLFWEGVRQGIALLDAEDSGSSASKSEESRSEQDFSTIVGEWIVYEEEEIVEYVSFSVDGVLCIKKDSSSDSCKHQITLEMVVKDKLYKWVEDDGDVYLLEVNEDVLELSENGIKESVFFKRAQR